MARGLKGRERAPRAAAAAPGAATLNFAAMMRLSRLHALTPANFADSNSAELRLSLRVSSAGDSESAHAGGPG